jgi:UDP-N-acetylmuramoylalanine--D-glutamate ligase
MSALPMTQTADDAETLPQRIAVLGFARSGHALAEALVDRGVSVAVSDSKTESELPGVEELRRRGVEFFLGGSGTEFLERAEWLAVSPGVPLSAPAVAAARERGLPVLAEVEVAYRIAEAESPGGNRWIAITGTNGKSTTTAWIAEILKRAGRPVALAGNIGAPLSGFLADREARDYVCELSSFQLEAIDRFRPHVAVLTNITPDHLDRYASFEDYAAAKARIFGRQLLEDFAVVNADDPLSEAIETPSRRVLFSRRGKPEGRGLAAWVEGDEIFWGEGESRRLVLTASELALPGAHNLENALAALAAAECLGISPAATLDTLTRFHGLPHRSELVAEGGGIRWVDDSKGTNVDASLKSLEGFADGTVILILGGRDKHGDFARLADLAAKRARLVLTIGEAAETIEKSLAGKASFERRSTMEQAVARAAEVARPGDTVLLSPACASFDQYRNFEERGRHFAALARAAAAR